MWEEVGWFLHALDDTVDVGWLNVGCVCAKQVTAMIVMLTRSALERDTTRETA